jgi:hypothetical protein
VGEWEWEGFGGGRGDEGRDKRLGWGERERFWGGMIRSLGRWVGKTLRILGSRIDFVGRGLIGEEVVCFWWAYNKSVFILFLNNFLILFSILFTFYHFSPPLPPLFFTFFNFF